MEVPKKLRVYQETVEYTKCGEIFHSHGIFQIICSECDGELFEGLESFQHHFQVVHQQCTQQDEELFVHLPGDVSPYKDKLFPDLVGFEAITVHTPESESDLENFSLVEENALKETEIIELSNPINDSNKKLALQLRRQHGCEICSKKFVTKKGLSKHIRKRHYEPKEFLCFQCDEKFLNQNSLWKHERMQHVFFTCTICTKSYKSRRGWRDHMATHSEQSTFKCDFEGCTKSFKSKRRLSDHKVIHDPSHMYVCEICGYTTVRKQTLVQHVRTHTGEKPFPCHICGKQFISSSMVNEHLATHTTERPHVCDVCGASFSRPKALYHHKPLHLGEKKFVCTICEKAYAQAAGLSAHMRKHKVDGKITIGCV